MDAKRTPHPATWHLDRHLDKPIQQQRRHHPLASCTNTNKFQPPLQYLALGLLLLLVTCIVNNTSVQGPKKHCDPTVCVIFCWSTCSRSIPSTLTPSGTVTIGPGLLTTCNASVTHRHLTKQHPPSILRLVTFTLRSPSHAPPTALAVPQRVRVRSVLRFGTQEFLFPHKTHLVTPKFQLQSVGHHHVHLSLRQ